MFGANAGAIISRTEHSIKSANFEIWKDLEEYEKKKQEGEITR